MWKFFRAIASIVLMAYLIVALAFTTQLSSERLCSGMLIHVNDSTRLRFVTARELAHELGDLPSRARGMKLSDIPLDSIERVLRGIDKIEHATVVALTDNYVLVTVDPMQPVARVFDGPHSYYINKDGKRISATARYHVDVPVIQGHFNDSTFPPRAVLPLVEYITHDSLWNSLVSMIKVDSPHDVLLFPVIRGQVINLGAPTDFDSKFSRLRRMYTEVLPIKGWNYYDTISVKWGGQIVATRRQKTLPQPFVRTDADEEADDIDSMLPI